MIGKDRKEKENALEDRPEMIFSGKESLSYLVFIFNSAIMFLCLTNIPTKAFNTDY